ncbi:vacuolar protein sorting-associated protein 41 [Meredithblackwellia eburnea MCA 4105]
MPSPASIHDLTDAITLVGHDSTEPEAQPSPLPTKSSPEASPPSPARINLIPSTSGLHTIKTQGSTRVAPIPLDESIIVEDSSVKQPLEGPECDTDSEEDSDDEEAEPRTEGSLGTRVVDDLKIDEPTIPPTGSRDGHSKEEERAESNGKGSQNGDAGSGEEENSEEEEDEDDEEGDDDDSDDEEEYSDDEDEPTLKYSRLEGGTTDILARDSASALAVSSKFIALGTHNGAVFILDFQSNIVKRFRPHQAMVNDLSFDLGSEFVASASMDGTVAILALDGSDNQLFDMRRPMRSVALDPNFGKRNTRQFVAGGMAESLVLHEKGWLGNKEVTLHSGEGPIWAAEWRGTFIAWANDAGVRIYDTASSQRITFISRSADSPRADLFKCTLHWKDDRTLLIAWADVIKVAVVKEREGKRGQLGVGLHTIEVFVEVTSIFQVDCMISGISPHGDSFIILAYNVEDLYDNEATDNRDEQRRKAGSLPELRIISADGEELSSDAIPVRNYDRFQCRDYSLCPSPAGESFYVISPNDIVLAQPRDEADHVSWLIEQGHYEEALAAIEKLGLTGVDGFDILAIGIKFLEHLVAESKFEKAAASCPKILGINAKLWEGWVYLFAEKGKLQIIIPYIPINNPQLSRTVYEMVLGHFLRTDPEGLLKTIRAWPHDIYNVGSVILAIQGQIERSPESKVLMESVAELFIMNRQPGKALPYFLKLRRPGVFDLIRENNLFTDVQDQALLLIEFYHDINKDAALPSEGTPVRRHGAAISLLVDHTHSIPIPRVVAQLQSNRKYLFMYLDALFDQDPHLAFDYSDLQVELYAEFEPNKLMDFLRASNYYSLEKAYKVCDGRDLVPEMVFLLGRMGDNKRALMLIIERLGDVQRAIEFAKEQNDNDLWEDLLKYSETKPRFIRGLLENVGAEIDPIRLIRRIKNGLEIPGLKLALIKILQDFNLQISLMEGCKTILYSDCRQLALTLHDRQTNGFLWTGDTPSHGTTTPIFPQLKGAPPPEKLPFGVHYLCGDTYDGETAFPGADLQLASQRDNLLAQRLLEIDGSYDAGVGGKEDLSAKLRLVSDLQARRGAKGCPSCSKTALQ